jgi:hypothetical protein
LALCARINRHVVGDARALQEIRRVKQQTLAGQSGFERYGKKTRREQFLEEMDQVVP